MTTFSCDKKQIKACIIKFYFLYFSVALKKLFSVLFLYLVVKCFPWSIYEIFAKRSYVPEAGLQIFKSIFYNPFEPYT